MEYVVRVTTRLDGRRLVHTYPALDASDAGDLANRLSGPVHSERVMSSAKRETEVCIRVHTIQGPILVPVDRLEEFIGSLQDAMQEVYGNVRSLRA